MSHILDKLREDLRHGDRSTPRRPSIPLFAEHPIECDELLKELFDAYENGAENALDIRMLMALQREANKFPSEKRSEALTRQGALRSAYLYPPTCLRTMALQLRDVVRLGAPSGHCEQLVRDYPAVAQSLLTQLLRKQKRDRFYNVWSILWRDTRPEIDTLRAMATRTRGNALLLEIEKEEKQ